jgi:hypothetical protein
MICSPILLDLARKRLLHSLIEISHIRGIACILSQVSSETCAFSHPLSPHPHYETVNLRLIYYLTISCFPKTILTNLFHLLNYTSWLLSCGFTDVFNLNLKDNTPHTVSKTLLHLSAAQKVGCGWQKREEEKKWIFMSHTLISILTNFNPFPTKVIRETGMGEQEGQRWQGWQSLLLFLYLTMWTKKQPLCMHAKINKISREWFRWVKVWTKRHPVLENTV